MNWWMVVTGSLLLLGANQAISSGGNDRELHSAAERRERLTTQTQICTSGLQMQKWSPQSECSAVRIGAATFTRGKELAATLCYPHKQHNPDIDKVVLLRTGCGPLENPCQ